MTKHTESVRSPHARYYRERASAIRARLPTLQDEEIFRELYQLAVHYERVAEFAEGAGPLEWPPLT